MKMCLPVFLRRRWCCCRRCKHDNYHSLNGDLRVAYAFPFAHSQHCQADVKMWSEKNRAWRAIFIEFVGNLGGEMNHNNDIIFKYCAAYDGIIVTTFGSTPLGIQSFWLSSEGWFQPGDGYDLWEAKQEGRDVWFVLCVSHDSHSPPPYPLIVHRDLEEYVYIWFFPLKIYDCTTHCRFAKWECIHHLNECHLS